VTERLERRGEEKRDLYSRQPALTYKPLVRLIRAPRANGGSELVDCWAERQRRAWARLQAHALAA